MPRAAPGGDVRLHGVGRARRDGDDEARHAQGGEEPVQGGQAGPLQETAFFVAERLRYGEQPAVAQGLGGEPDPLRLLRAARKILLGEAVRPLSPVVEHGHTPAPVAHEGEEVPVVPQDGHPVAAGAGHDEVQGKAALGKGKERGAGRRRRRELLGERGDEQPGQMGQSRPDELPRVGRSGRVGLLRGVGDEADAPPPVLGQDVAGVPAHDQAHDGGIPRPGHSGCDVLEETQWDFPLRLFVILLFAILSPSPAFFARRCRA